MENASRDGTTGRKSAFLPSMMKLHYMHTPHLGPNWFQKMRQVGDSRKLKYNAIERVVKKHGNAGGF